MVTAGLGIQHRYNDQFFYERSHSKKRYVVRECDRNEWAKFRRYHYLNTEIAQSCKCYGLYDDDVIIGFMGVLHQPHGINKKIKRVSRLVILPDYQGIGLGYKFLTIIAKKYFEQGYDFSIVTSAKNLIMKLYRSENWAMKRLSINNCSSAKSSIDYNRSSMRNRCKTASFFYVASGNAQIPNEI